MLLEPNMASTPHKFTVAPMMEWTDRHCRVFHRVMSKYARLYTEMVTADAVIHGIREKIIGFSDVEHPVAVQLGGSNPETLAHAAQICEQAGYDEINLNIGCPSDRVQDGRFGACLMAEPDRVAACVQAMQGAVGVPVTVKCRIGIDDQDSEADFQTFVDRVADVGCRIFVVHARKAWLTGLSPKENRDIPPLNYDRVYRLKAQRPELTVVINGGIETLDQADAHLMHVDGVMLGRAAYHTPYLLADVDARYFGSKVPPLQRSEILLQYRPYVVAALQKEHRLNAITRHILGLMHGQRNGRKFRRLLSGEAMTKEAGIDLYDRAIDLVCETEKDFCAPSGAVSAAAQ